MQNFSSDGAEPHPQQKLSADQIAYLEELKNYKARGVKITIDDDCQLPFSEWDKIFMLADRSADGAHQFYMSDIVMDENGEILEIRVDKITVR